MFDRYCVGKLDAFDTFLCSYCGSANGSCHWYPTTGDYMALDSSGNTKLHYAAASKGADLNLFRLLIENGVDIGARNYSGETFIHVLNVKEFIFSHRLFGFLELLKFLSNLGFPFTQRDFHGCTIVHSFYQNGWPYSIFSYGDGKEDFNSRGLHEILQILKIDMNALDNYGFNAGDEILQSVRDSGYKLGSQVMVQVEGAVTRFTVKSRLKTNFQKSLAELDWTPSRWIDWLQKENLITWIDTHGDTPLTALVKNRRSEDQQAALSGMIPELVKLGVDINMRDRKGHTTIAIAAIRGSLSCVQALINSGASVKKH